MLHEELLECSFVNNLHPGDTVGALTFVLAVEEDVGGDLEAITMRTVGVKNIDGPLLSQSLKCYSAFDH